MDPNSARIQEYRAGIDAAARQLAQEEAELAKAKTALPLQAAPLAAPSAARMVYSTPSAYGPTTAADFREPSRPLAHPPGDRTLYASNIAVSYRPAPSLGPEKTVAQHAATEPLSGDAFLPNDHAGLYRVWEGTVLETVLTNRLDSSFAGPVNALVTTDVYASDHATVLVPQGSRVLGEVRKLEGLGEQRLAVSFHRLVRPDGYSMSLDKFQGLNQIGETGLRDQVNHHYAQVFGASVAIGALAGLAQANSHYGTDQTAADAYGQGVASSLSQSSMHVLDRYLNVLPTFTIREGHRIKVYLSQDLELPPYATHRDLNGER